LNNNTPSNEAPETYQARKKLKQLLYRQNYEIEEEVQLDTVTNNMGEEIWPPYRADMLLTKSFIIELDSKKLHGTHRRIVHDSWRDKNIKNQINLKTVRLLSKNVNVQSEKQILEEIEDQLKRFDNDNNDNK